MAYRSDETKDETQSETQGETRFVADGNGKDRDRDRDIFKKKLSYGESKRKLIERSQAPSRLAANRQRLDGELPFAGQPEG